MPISEATVAKLSKTEPWRLAAAMPSGTPTPIATTIAARDSSIVAGKRVRKLVTTETRFVAEVPEVAPEDAGHVVEVLLVEGLVEAQPMAAGGQPVGRRVLTEDRAARVAGQGVHQHDDEDREPEQDRDQEDEPANDVLEHGLTVLGNSGPRKRRSPPGTGSSRLEQGQDPASFQTRLKYSVWVGLGM